MYHVWFALAHDKDNTLNVISTCQKAFDYKIINYDMMEIPEKYKQSLRVIYHSEDVLILNKLVLKSEKEVDIAMQDFTDLGWSISSESIINKLARSL